LQCKSPSDGTETSVRLLVEKPEVTLTTSHLRIDGEDFELGDILSAASAREPAPAAGPTLMIMAGLLCLLAGATSAGAITALLGAVLVVAAGAWWRQKRPTYQLRLQIGSAELAPFESEDPAVTERIVAALEEVQGRAQGAPR